MTSWDDLDTFKLNLQPHFQGASRPNTAWQGGFQHVHQTFAPPKQSTLSLDRYLQLLQLLCGGQPSAAANTTHGTNTWTVRQLGELERAAVKMEDLKKVLTLNGRVISAKNKQDMLDKMAGLQLASPVFFTLPAPPDAINPAIINQNPREDVQKRELEQGIQRALQWADLSPSESTLAAAAISRQGCYSFCPLPEIKLPSSSSTQAPLVASSEVEREVLQQQQQHRGIFPFQQPATSATTFASRPAVPNAHIAESSSPPNPSSSFHPIALIGGNRMILGQDTEMHDAVLQNHHHQKQPGPPSSSVPEWLITGYKNLSKICRGTSITPDLGSNSSSNEVSKNSKLNNNLVGRKVALVLMEDFCQDGDFVDKISRGLHLGQVVEWTGDLHDSDTCPVNCTLHHNFCYVRVTPTETTAPAHRRSRRRLDLAVDLREEYRLDTLEDLLLVGGKQLADAWVLVEPKDFEEEEDM